MLYGLTVLAGLFLHALITLPLLLKIFGGRSPVELFKKVTSPILMAFSSASSSATLPLTMESLEKKADVSPQSTSFVLPLGATINMDGTALYEAVAALFIAQVSGIDLSIGQQLVVCLTASLVSVGAAGIPGAGLVMMGIVLNAVGLPMDKIALILAIDRFLDMFRTSINVWGDMIGACIIDNIVYRKGKAN